MLIDITLGISKKMMDDAMKNEKKALEGHIGTHFDVMDKVFPLEYTKRKAVVFDVSSVKGRDIGISDIDISMAGADMFVAFYTGFIEDEGYGTLEYFTKHPQLSNELIEELLNRKISVIGVDFAGIRRGAEHTPKDGYCADKGIFIVENLCNLKEILNHGNSFTAHTYPMKLTESTGLPCRVIAEV